MPAIPGTADRVAPAGRLDSGGECEDHHPGPPPHPMVIPSLTLLRIADFRRLGTAVALNSIGMMGENVVLGWLTLELTNSPFLVGVAMAMRSISLFFVGVPA